MPLDGVTLDGEILFAIVFALIALAVVGGVVGFALWYVSDQEEL